MAKFDSVCVRGRSRFKHDDVVKRRKQNFKRGAGLLIKSRYECAGVDNGFSKLFFASLSVACLFRSSCYSYATFILPSLAEFCGLVYSKLVEKNYPMYVQRTFDSQILRSFIRKRFQYIREFS